MKSAQKGFIAAVLICVAAAAAVLFAVSGGKNEGDGGEGKNRAKPQPAGYTVTISEEAQETGGITTIALKPGLYRQQVTAYGEVLTPDGLGAAYRNYIAATSGVEKMKALRGASAQEYARLKVLNENGKNISDRVLQAAAAQLSADRAEETAALGALRSIRDTIRINWGPVVADWIFRDKPPLREIIEGKDVLVRLAISPAASLKGIPGRVSIRPPAGGRVPARFVSRAPSAGPRIQGMSLIYIAAPRSGALVPGMNVTAQIPAPGTQSGFFIPVSAVVWLQDKAWVYVKKSNTGFSRVAVPASNPMDKGYFVPGVFSAGDQVVVKGAQALLSEESAPKAAGAGGGQEEGDED
ncbi:MAG TPA: hypothetical protein VF790_11805 [Dissulfurispiraceae bacterium]